MTIRNRVAGITAVAALTVGAPIRTTSFAGPIRPPKTSASLAKLPQMQQADVVEQLFKHAKSVEEWNYAESVWNDLGPGITGYETSLSCKDFGESYDEQIGKDLIFDMFEKPVELYLDVTKFILSFAAGEKDEAREALEEAISDLKEEIRDHNAKKPAKDITRRILPKLEEALLKYFQSLKKRSRKHYLKVIKDIEDIALAYGGLAYKVSGALKPSKITPDECGMINRVERERSHAMRRVFVHVGDKQPLLLKHLENTGPSLRRP
jgi:hypothetical protein